MTGDEPGQVETSEIELLRLQNAQLESSLLEARSTADQRLIQVELRAEAIKAGMVDLDGLKLIEPGSVSIDEHGTVHGASTVMTRLRRDKPWLFGSQSSSSAAPVPAHGSTRPKSATDMSLDEWRAARADLLRRR
jgi:hypothetical protein